MAKLGKILGPYFLSLGSSSQKITVTLVDETDGVTLETFITSPTIQASKNGAAYADLSDGTWTELGNGDYVITLDSTDTDTLGPLFLRIIKTGTSSEAKVQAIVAISGEEWRSDYLRTRTLHRGR